MAEINGKIKKNSEVNKSYTKYLLKWGLLCTAQGVLSYFRKFHNTDLANRISFRLRSQIYNQLVDKNIRYFYSSKLSSQNYVHKIANDVTVISNSLT